MNNCSPEFFMIDLRIFFKTSSLMTPSKIARANLVSSSGAIQRQYTAKILLVAARHAMEEEIP